MVLHSDQVKNSTGKYKTIRIYAPNHGTPDFIKTNTSGHKMSHKINVNLAEKLNTPLLEIDRSTR